MNMSINDIEVISMSQRLLAVAEDISAIFEEQDKNFARINGTSIWTSESQLSCASKYAELSKIYPEIIDSLKTYASFLESAGIAYRDLDKRLVEQQNQVL